MTPLRAILVAATIAALASLGFDRNPPSRMVETPYCVVDYRAAAKDPMTCEWVEFWTAGYRPCSEQDRFVNA